MIAFKGDERFADVEYGGVTYEPAGRVVKLLVTSDPADNCETVVLRDVVSFDVIHFTRQNVVHYLDIARVTASEHREFVELAQNEGAKMTLTADPAPDILLGIVFVPASGATIFAICGAVEKCMRDGQSVCRVTP